MLHEMHPHPDAESKKCHSERIKKIAVVSNGVRLTLIQSKTNMYLHKNLQRLRETEVLFITADHTVKDSKASEKTTAGSNRSSTTALSDQPHTAEYLFNLSRPPLEDGMQEATDPLMQRFFQGEIPDESEQQSRIAHACMDYGFPKALAWLFAKTKMTEFTCRPSLGHLAPYTLATALRYQGLALNSLVIDLPSMSCCGFEDLLELNGNDSLKKLDFSSTAMGQALLDVRGDIKGLHGQIVVTGGRV